MRFRRVPLFLGCAAFIALAAAAYSCGIYGAPETLAKDAKVPGRIHKSVIRGNLLVALLHDHRLVSVDLTTGATKDFGKFESPYAALDVAGNKACVASKKGVVIVDLTDGKINPAGSVEHDASAIGFLTADRLFVQAGPQIKVMDLTSGKTVQEFSLGKADPKSHYSGFHTLGRSGKNLYVSVAKEKGAVAVVDLETGDVVDRYSAAELRVSGTLTHHTEHVFAGDKVFALSSRLAYGVWVEAIGIVDLKTRQYTAMKLPSNAMHSPSLVPGPRNTVFLTSSNGIYQFDTSGKQTATMTPTGERVDAALLGVWQGKALIADGGLNLRQVALPATTAQAK